MGRLLLVIAVVLILAPVPPSTSALDDAANIVQILQVIFDVLVWHIDLFVARRRSTELLPETAS